MNEFNVKIAELLKIEIEHLNSGISGYSSKIFKTTAGTLAIGIAMIWYSIQKPEAKGMLALVSSFGFHAAVISLIYYYAVYRTLKEAKRIQAERVNYFFDKIPILIWEEVWNKIWGSSKKIGHSKLAWVIFSLFVSAFSVALLPLIFLASGYIIQKTSSIRIVFLTMYWFLMALLPYCEIRIAYHYISNIGDELEEYSKLLELSDEKHNKANSADAKSRAAD